jgi:hypothetical protein
VIGTKLRFRKGDVSISMPAPPPSKLSTEMFAALERAQKKVSPEAITLPTMTMGATDSSFLRKRDTPPGDAIRSVGVITITLKSPGHRFERSSEYH